MPDYHHFTNMRTPLDSVSLATLEALSPDYRISLPIEAESVPGGVPVPQAVMVANGIVGVYTTLEAAQRDVMAPHTPMYPIPVSEWLPTRPRLG